MDTANKVEEATKTEVAMTAEGFTVEEAERQHKLGLCTCPKVVK